MRDVIRGVAIDTGRDKSAVAAAHTGMDTGFVDFDRFYHWNMVLTDDRFVLMAAPAGMREVVGIGGRFRIRRRENVMGPMTVVAIGE